MITINGVEYLSVDQYIEQLTIEEYENTEVDTFAMFFS